VRTGSYFFGDNHAVGKSGLWQNVREVQRPFDYFRTRGIRGGLHFPEFPISIAPFHEKVWVMPA
jgi:hypothetical protein